MIEGSAKVTARVAATRDLQRERYPKAGLSQVTTNVEAPAAVLDDIAKLEAPGKKLLREAAETMRLSAPRAAYRAHARRTEALSHRALAEDSRHAA